MICMCVHQIQNFLSLSLVDISWTQYYNAIQRYIGYSETGNTLEVLSAMADFVTQLRATLGGEIAHKL